MFQNILLVAAGGAAGSVARFLIGSFVLAHPTRPFYYSTLVINVVGSLIIGALAGLGERNGMSHEMTLLLATGFCGGFTTFSTFSLEVLRLLQSGEYLPAFGYIATSILFGIGAAFAGYAMVKP
jgi:CrcB protein